MSVIVSVAIVLWANILELVDTTTFWAALDWALTGCHEPDNNVGVCWATGAAHVLLVAEGLDLDWVLERSFSRVSSRLLLYLLQEWYHSPFRLASKGRMSKISMPCIFPRISNRSRPVDCSRSVGMVPGLAPGGRRSCSSLTSVVPLPSAICPRLSTSTSRVFSASLTFELLQLALWRRSAVIASCCPLVTARA